MRSFMTKREAEAFVAKYCQALEVELSEKDKQKLAAYLRLQDKNRRNKQKTLIPEDSDVMAELSKVLEE